MCHYSPVLNLHVYCIDMYIYTYIYPTKTKPKLIRLQMTCGKWTMCKFQHSDTIISVLFKQVSLHGYYTGISLYRPVADLFDDWSKQELSYLICKEKRTDSRLDSD